jgi:hypothetical protein
MLTIGTYYYREAWPENEWARPMTNIRKLAWNPDVRGVLKV